jgi:methylated-DNA-[protein]-cysteine S-methyltransferase
MARNRFAPLVPCHRVLGARGQPGGFSARGGLRTKLQLLSLEHARLSAEPDLFADSRNSAQ